MPQSKKGQTNRRGANDTVVLDALLADRTGAIKVTCCEECAAEMLALMKQGPKPKAKVRMLRLEVLRTSPLSASDWNGSSLTPINIVHTQSGAEGTKLTLIDEFKSPFMVSVVFAPPNESLLCYISIQALGLRKERVVCVFRIHAFS